MSLRQTACTAWAACLMLAACGGGAGSSSPSGPPLPTGSNVAPVLVDAGSAGLGVNLPSVSVTICVPGTTTCQTIDHILLDTASTGLRIVASVLNASVALPAVKTTGGDPLYECFEFADGYTWGSVRQADIQIADGKAAAMSLQLIGDPAIPTAPADCSDINTASPITPENTVNTLGQNGVLGVSVFQQDCGAACVTVANPGGLGFYYGCPANACAGITIATADQLQNPVSLFATDNNGVVVVLPKIQPAGEPSASGVLVLGIDTQSNNQLGSAAVLTVDPTFGNFATIYKGQTLASSVIDSGSAGYYFNDSSLTACTHNTGYYCPPTVVTLSAQQQGANGAMSTVSFNIASADALTNANPGYAAFNDIGATITTPQAFDWGLPFFYGRSVSVAIEGRSTAAGTGPFVAY